MVTAVPPRLRIGIIGSGRVGAVLGAALRRVGHQVTGVSARTDLSRVRAEALLPGVPIRPMVEVAADCDLLLLTVTDDALASVAAEIAVAVHPGQYVAHTAGRFGVQVLQAATAAGALPLALHPAMTFTGTSLDLARLEDCPFAVTADDSALPIAEALVIEMGGDPIRVDEQARVLYHAAMAHGANHLVTLVAQTRELLTLGGVTDPGRLIAPLLRAALDNALREGDAALTGPVARGDVGTLIEHLRELQVVDERIAESYRSLAVATAQRARDAGTLSAEQADAVIATVTGIAPEPPASTGVIT
jgi:predicted short-subunit dehydrogenase-like oxidoreductase (DUF2520 family)